VTVRPIGSRPGSPVEQGMTRAEWRQSDRTGRQRKDAMNDLGPRVVSVRTRDVPAPHGASPSPFEAAQDGGRPGEWLIAVVAWTG
ncbi:MAG: hypothetical protein AAGF76_11900, partial [Pseudomonadota bacterium]